MKSKKGVIVPTTVPLILWGAFFNLMPKGPKYLLQHVRVNQGLIVLIISTHSSLLFFQGFCVLQLFSLPVTCWKFLVMINCDETLRWTVLPKVQPFWEYFFPKTVEGTQQWKILQKVCFTNSCLLISTLVHFKELCVKTLIWKSITFNF